MITYDPGKWGVWFALTCTGSVFPKSFCIAFPGSLVVIVFHILQDRYPNYFSNLVHNEGSSVHTSVLGGFTFILGFLIVFRSQQAYSRWWEGGSLLQQIRGEWFNAYSSLLAFCNADATKSADVFTFQHRLARTMSLLYASALEQVTTMECAVFEMIELEGFDEDSLRFLLTCHDRCEIVLQWTQRLIVEADSKGTIKVAPPILSRVYNQLGNGIVNLNNARKITEFPIPFPLAQMVAFMLAAHLLLTIYICATFIHSTTWAFIICFIVIFSFWTVNYIAMELELPFGDDMNDLPLQEMQIDFNKSVQSMLHPIATRIPSYEMQPGAGDLRRSSLDIASYLESLIVREGTRADMLDDPEAGRKKWRRSAKLAASTEQDRKSTAGTWGSAWPSGRRQSESSPRSEREEKDGARPIDSNVPVGKLSSGSPSPAAVNSSLDNETDTSKQSAMELSRTDPSATQMPGGMQQPKLPAEIQAAGLPPAAHKAGEAVSSADVQCILPMDATADISSLSRQKVLASADIIEVNKRMEEHLSEVVRQLKAIKGIEANHYRSLDASRSDEARFRL